jgi:GR25 family glycosyltransferase involved in LPS biosynthesis
MGLNDMSLLVIILGPLSSLLNKSLESALGSEFSLMEVEFVDASNRTEWLEWDSGSSTRGMGVGKGAAGCWLAHKQAWTVANTSDCENILILEDDARITKYGTRHLQQTVEMFKNSNLTMLHLGDHERAIFLQPIRMLISGNIRIILKHILERIIFYPLKPKFALARFPFSAHGYLLKRSILPNLIKSAPLLIFPVDVFLNAISQVQKNRTASVRTPLIVQAQNRESLIDKLGR